MQAPTRSSETVSSVTSDILQKGKEKAAELFSGISPAQAWQSASSYLFWPTMSSPIAAHSAQATPSHAEIDNPISSTPPPTVSLNVPVAIHGVTDSAPSNFQDQQDCLIEGPKNNAQEGEEKNLMFAFGNGFQKSVAADDGAKVVGQKSATTESVKSRTPDTSRNFDEAKAKLQSPRPGSLEYAQSRLLQLRTERQEREEYERLVSPRSLRLQTINGMVSCFLFAFNFAAGC